MNTTYRVKGEYRGEHVDAVIVDGTIRGKPEPFIRTINTLINMQALVVPHPQPQPPRPFRPGHAEDVLLYVINDRNTIITDISPPPPSVEPEQYDDEDIVF